MIDAFLKYEFLQNALAVGLLSAIICGIIGVIITEKKILMLSGGIAHTAYGGVGLGYLLGIEPIIGAILFSVASAVVIGKINLSRKIQSDIVISLLWSAGMASGIVFTGMLPGYPPDMNSYLFGNILLVSRSDFYIILGLSIVTLLIFFVFRKDWKAYLFDPAFANILGLSTAILEYTLLILVALCVVALIKAVGIILVIALLCAPAATASLISKTLKGRIIFAVIFTLFFNLTGLALSFSLSIASGATIVLVAVITYFTVLLLSSANKLKSTNK